MLQVCLVGNLARDPWPFQELRAEATCSFRLPGSIQAAERGYGSETGLPVYYSSRMTRALTSPSLSHPGKETGRGALCPYFWSGGQTSDLDEVARLKKPSVVTNPPVQATVRRKRVDTWGDKRNRISQMLGISKNGEPENSSMGPRV